jgi:hypothetical protein
MFRVKLTGTSSVPKNMNSLSCSRAGTAASTIISSATNKKRELATATQYRLLLPILRILQKNG